MRYTDAPSTETEIHISAPLERVWEVATDITVYARPGGELQHTRWADGVSGPRLGARFIGRNRNPHIGEWETTSVVVEFDPPWAFAWDVLNKGEAMATWRFDLRPLETGTVLRQWVRIGPAPSGLSMFIERNPDKEEELIARRLAELRGNMAGTLEVIRGLAEGRSAPAPRSDAAEPSGHGHQKEEAAPSPITIQPD
ncbi:MAG: SRPBCC family protein [Nocardiopsaceae bacterium]|nr:SRPBCC family protein [Nocardiopsaceae bacterium]